MAAYRPLAALSRRKYLSTMRDELRITVGLAAGSAFILRSVDKVQVLLFKHSGTFAEMPCLAVSDKDFTILRTK